MRLSLLLFVATGLLAGCDQLGILTPAQQAAKVDAEGKAIGSACRQAGRALEDCYQISPKTSKSSIFDGWRDMDAYMRENKLEVVTPQFPVTPPNKKKASGTNPEPAPAVDEKPAETKDAPPKAVEGKGPAKST
jgi:hypothetical protein